MSQHQEILDQMLENRVVKRVMHQQLKGVKKYGSLVDKYNLPAKHWMQHLQEELVDAHVYTETFIQLLDSIRSDLMEAMVHIERGDPNVAYYRLEEIVEQIGV